jgi:hypothetical protein
MNDDLITQCGALHRAVNYLIAEKIPHNGAVAVVRVPDDQDTLWDNQFKKGERGTKGLWQVSLRHMPSDHPAFKGRLSDDPSDLNMYTFPVFVDIETGACALFPTL